MKQFCEQMQNHRLHVVLQSLSVQRTVQFMTLALELILILHIITFLGELIPKVFKMATTL